MNSQNSSALIKRKRGRPRKNQESTSQSQKKLSFDAKTELNSLIEKKNSEDDEIILQLPINFSDIKKANVNLKNKNEQKKHEENDSKNSSSSLNDTNIFTITDLSYDTLSDEDSYEVKINKDAQKIIKQQEEKIKNLENEVKEYKSLLDEKINTGFIEKRVSKMNINFIDNKSGEQKILDCVDICCWWCTYEFDTLPCFIPEKYDDGKYYVFGCFCSFNCAASYNINTNDYKIWERYSLLKKLYNKIHNTNEDISLAPDRETLKKFGGPLTIDEFRKNNNICEKEYRFIMPPMVSIIPLIEETFKDNVKFRKIKSFGSDDNLVLKRNKPLPNTKSNLIDTLGILRRKKIK